MSPASEFIRHLDEVTGEGAALLGGKGWNLALLHQAGLPVPDAFCITSDAHRRAKNIAGATAGITASSADSAASSAGSAQPASASLVKPTGCVPWADPPPDANAPTASLPPELAPEILIAYDRLGGCSVAVRSSATVEDGAAASFAGLQETILGVEGHQPLLDAVARCWRSIDSQRARAYRGQAGIDENQVAMAVVVQRLVAAETAGVLFTRDPLDASGQGMLVEASWGLGEAVVSGLVTPDRFQIDRQSGGILSEQIHRKTLEVTAAGRQAVPDERQTVACLSAAQLTELAELGRRVEAYYGEPRDVEWAWADGRLWLLQARPITAAGAAEREAARERQIARLRQLADERGTVWARYNLAEVLPTPTPMTWAIVSHFMSGQGGLGRMFRDLGFDPDPIIDRLGFIDLVCGRPYVNLSREARLHFTGFPYGHNFQALKADPQRALYPQPTPDPAQVSARFVVRLPIYLFKMLRAARRIERTSRTLAERLRQTVFPSMAAEARVALAEPLDKLSGPQLLARLDAWRRRTLDDFARDSLKSATLAATALAKLEAGLAAELGGEQAATAARALLSGIEPDAGADLAAALDRLARGELSPAEFLEHYGHRGPQEMELSAPRWRERPDLLPAPMLPAADARERAAGATGGAPADARPKSLDAPANRRQLERLQTYMALRESGKHYLMLGYAVIRQTLVELGRRSGIADGIFFLLPDELPELIAGADLNAAIARRRRERLVDLSLDVPTVLFSDDLEAIGRPVEIAASAELKGTPVSAGAAEGPALVLQSPEGAPPGDGFVLVCPSTDPAWVPLFLRARALVMETGGILSHGAIVAREFGLPAVVGVDRATERLRSGQRLRVDGNTGRVQVLD